MLVDNLIKILYYVCHIVKGLVDIVLDKDESLYNDDGKLVAKLPSKRKQVLVFAKNFFNDPVMLGSLVPSSQFLTNKLLAPIDFDHAKVIVEFGAGVGNISIELLKRMRPDAKLIVFELHQELAKFLKTEFSDPRFHAYGRSAADLEAVLAEHGLEQGQVDYVISGIPFSTIPQPIGKQIIEVTKLSLKPNGKFLIYQFRSKVLELIEPLFNRIDRDRELVNIPPLKLFFASNE